MTTGGEAAVESGGAACTVVWAVVCAVAAAESEANEAKIDVPSRACKATRLNPEVELESINTGKQDTGKSLISPEAWMNVFESAAICIPARLRCFCMETTKVAGVEVSRVGLGTWAIGGSEWGAVAEDAAIATCLSAIERGINLFDTAPIYGRGRAEEIIGKAMRAHGRRASFYIATKAGLEWNERGVFANSTAARLRRGDAGRPRRPGATHSYL